MNARPPLPQPDPTQIRDIGISEGRVRVRSLGRGPTTLFLHGVSAQARSWLPVAKALQSSDRQLTCLLPDLLGRGESDADPELRFSLDDEVRRLRELVDALALTNSTSTQRPGLVVGHSHGAAIALAYARTEPSVRALLLSNPVTAAIRRPMALAALDSRLVRGALARGLSPLHQTVGRIVLWRAGGPHYQVPQDTRDAYAAPFADPMRARTLLRVLADWRPAELATRMPSRKLVAHVIAGAHDPRVPVESARRLAEQLEAEFTCVANGGHILPEQEPQLVADAISRLQQRLD